MNRLWVIAIALGIVLSLPFVLRPQYDHDPRLASSPDQILNIITPHSESIRQEFTTAFRQHIRETEGCEVFIEWRVPGGTSEIEKILDTEYTFAFKDYWVNERKLTWSSSVAAAFANRKHVLPDDPGDDTIEDKARRSFLDSKVSANFDLFFGGGAYPFVVNAAKGYLVDSGLFDRHPEWFAPEIIPAEVGGEPFYDPDKRWMGCCLSTFGVCYNLDALKRLGLDDSTVDWSTLAKPEMFKEVALADPSMSGTVTKAFEMILQQSMRRQLDKQPDIEAEALALAKGWWEGFNLIRRIGANARYYANYSAKIPADVAAGNAAAGMSIDYYGRTFNELLQDSNGRSRLMFVMPRGGSSTSVDPIAMLRGAPNKDLAAKFIDFVFSKRGQQLWNNRAGSKNGPLLQSLRRLPVRRDLYSPNNLADFSDPEVMPFEKSHLFHYEAAWTGRAFGAIRFIMKAMCLDAHDELQTALQALIENDFPPEATAAFDDLSPVAYELALGEIVTILKQGKREQSAYAIKLSEYFRDRYRQTADLAKAGR